jgi:twitching motility protein PilI
MKPEAGDSVDDPLAILRVMERRGRRGPSEAPAPTRGWHALAFRTAGVALLVARNDVRAVHPVSDLTRVPGVAPWVAGVANVAGALLPVIDLTAFVEGIRGGTERRAAVLQVRVGEEDGAGLLVEALLGERWVPEGAPSSGAPHTPPPLQPYLAAPVELEDGLWPVLSIERLTASPSLLQTAE